MDRPTRRPAGPKTLRRHLPDRSTPQCGVGLPQAVPGGRDTRPARVAVGQAIGWPDSQRSGSGTQPVVLSVNSRAVTTQISTFFPAR